MSSSLRRTKTNIPFFVVVPDGFDVELVKKIEGYCDGVIKVSDYKLSDDSKENNKFSYWNNTFFKLQIMKLTQFDKIVYIDSDMLVLNNLDKLFDFPGLSATTGSKSAHPEYTEFNSGIMVIEPNEKEYTKLISCVELAIDRKKKEGKGYGDQDVFNEYFKDWNDHPEHNFGEEYNATYAYIDDLMKAKRYTDLKQINVIHYVGPDKIWNNSVWKNLRLIIRYLHEGRIYTAKAWWLYMKWMKKVKNI